MGISEAFSAWRPFLPPGRYVVVSEMVCLVDDVPPEVPQFFERDYWGITDVAIGVSGLLPLEDLRGIPDADGRVMDALDDAYRLPVLFSLPVANGGAAEVLGELTRRGIRLGLICNTGRTPGSMLRQVLDRLGLSVHLRVLTFSDEVGLRKPHREIFSRTLAALDVSPEEAAHVGDDVTTDVAGARGIGMRPIHLCHPTSASGQSDGAQAISRLADLPTALFGAGS